MRDTAVSQKPPSRRPSLQEAACVDRTSPAGSAAASGSPRPRPRLAPGSQTPLNLADRRILD